MKTLIIGAGYVGRAIGTALLSEGDEVTVTTTTASKVIPLENLGFKTLLVELGDPLLIEILGDYDRVLFTVAPRNFEEYAEVYSAPARILKAAIKVPSHVLYTSSTGVYGKGGSGFVDEEASLSPQTEREKILCSAEDELQKEKRCKISILRLGGIIGPGRELKSRLGSPLPGNPDQPFNWVALNDIVGSALFTLQKNLDGVFNVISSEGMTRGESYAKVADQYHLPPPVFDSSLTMSHGGSKYVSNRKLRSLGYTFVGELE